MKPQIIIFEHIPKTAGRTVQWILYRQFGPNETFVTESREHAARLKELNIELANGSSRVKLIRSHAGYGIHQSLSENYDYRSFTILRDPIARTISYYRYDLKHGKISPDLLLSDYVTQQKFKCYNQQTRFLCGTLWEEWQQFRGASFANEVSSTDVDRAIDNLSTKIESFGLQERFDESLVLLRNQFGWPLWKTMYVPQNMTAAPGETRQFAVEELDAVRQCNLQDTKLYEWAVSEFERRWLSLEPHASRSLKRYRISNGVFKRIFPTLSPAMRTIHNLARRSK